MFDRDLYGLTTRFDDPHLRGGVAPGRHALRKAQYLEDRRARLAAEADERKRQDIEAENEAVLSVLDKLLGMMRAGYSAVRVRRQALGG